MFPVAVTVICVDVVAARHVVGLLKDHARVVVRDHVGVSVLGLVHLQRGVVPGELLAGLDALRTRSRVRICSK